MEELKEMETQAKKAEAKDAILVSTMPGEKGGLKPEQTFCKPSEEHHEQDINYWDSPYTLNSLNSGLEFRGIKIISYHKSNVKYIAVFTRSVWIRYRSSLFA